MFFPYGHDQTKSLYAALDIATHYLVLRGYNRLTAQEKAGRHIAANFNSGERRALMLANKAIAAVEKEEASRSAALLQHVVL